MVEYTDTDVELLKPLDPFWLRRGFLGEERRWNRIDSYRCVGWAPVHTKLLEHYRRNSFSQTLILTRSAALKTLACLLRYSRGSAISVYPKIGSQGALSEK